MITPVQIRHQTVGANQPCFIIAEAGVNHNGDMALAHRLINEAAQAGADAVKFQMFITEDLITDNAPKANYQVETTGEAGSQYKMLKSLELNATQQAELKAHCQEAGILYICTPYDHTSIDVLDQMDIAVYKIASTDVTNTPFLRYIASKGRPVILSTGMSVLAEVELAVNTLKAGGLEDKIIILQCTAEYPAPINEVNLRAIQTMQQAFNCPVGLSDHTPGIGAGPWSVAVGSCMLEKHFTLDRNLPGPDHPASLEPDELAQLVQTVRNVEAALGDGIKRPMLSEIPNKPFMQKSLVARKALPKGHVITEADLICKRPATGLPPHSWDQVIGQSTARDIDTGETLTLSCINWQDESESTAS